MIEKLKVNVLYDDFVSKVKLTDEQKRILDMMINKDTIVKMSLEIGVSTSTIDNEVRKIKNLYNKYLQIEIIKMISLID